MNLTKEEIVVLGKYLPKIEAAVSKAKKGDMFSLKELLNGYWRDIPIGERRQLGRIFHSHANEFEVEALDRDSSNTSMYRKL